MFDEICQIFIVDELPSILSRQQQLPAKDHNSNTSNMIMHPMPNLYSWHWKPMLVSGQHMQEQQQQSLMLPPLPVRGAATNDACLSL